MALDSLALAVGKRLTNVWVGAILLITSYGLGQVLLIRSFAYISHRLAVQAEIGQNRLIFRIAELSGPVSIGINRCQPNPPARTRERAQILVEDVQEEACRPMRRR